MTGTGEGSRTGILQQISAPLGFYVLTLLIVEATLSVVLVGSALDSDKKWYGFLLMIAVFLLVVGIVTYLVIHQPKNLVFGKEEHAAPHTEPSALRDQIEDLIFARVKKDCLKPGDS